jgi:opacity protein-like surface antigen
MRFLSAAAAALVAVVAASPAMAQDSGVPTATVYAGPSAGYHDLGADVPGDEGGAIFGGVLGFDIPIATNVVLGAEGNLHGGEGAIDKEYGIAGRLGVKFPSGGVAFVRAGYQWVDVDVGNLAGVDIDEDDLDISDTVDDYLVGVGGEFPVGPSGLRLRVGVDTISVDSIRPTAGLLLSF